MTAAEALRKARRYLEERGLASPRLDAELMLASILGESRSSILAHPEIVLSAAQQSRFHSWLQKRGRHYPIQYLRGVQEFYGRNFRVTPDVLIPRPETELLVDTALAWVASKAGDRLRICDVGSGSGCIGITLALEDPRLRVLAIDISRPALAVARQNAAGLGCAGIEFLQCDTLSAIRPLPVFDLLISNPPYVGRQDRKKLDPAVDRYEPHEALFSGDDGLAVFQKLMQQGAGVLGNSGRLIVELGYGLKEGVLELAEKSGWTLEAVHDDLASIPRCAVFSNPPPITCPDDRR